MAQYLHMTCICTQATAGCEHTALHLHGFSIVLSAWQIQGLLFGTLWDVLPPEYFQSRVDLIHRCEALDIEGQW